MPLSVRRECPVCVNGTGLARRAVVVPEKPGVAVTMACQSCGHEWTIQHDPPPPFTPPDENSLAS
jgi:hypothetical protein